MFVLTIYHHDDCIAYNLHKVYGKKFILTEIHNISIDKDNLVATKRVIGKKNISSKIIQQDFNNEFNHQDIATYIMNTVSLPDIIVSKISNGYKEFGEISRINKSSLDKLSQIYSSKNQKNELSLAYALETLFENSKHYACFDDNYNNKNQLNINTKCLNFKSIINKLYDITTKKVTKSNIVIIHINKSSYFICSVKNLNNYYFDIIPYTDDSKDVTKLIANKICSAIIEMSGIDMLVFSGNTHYNSPQLRENICQNLGWFGVSISNKPNKNNAIKLHKKSSTIQVFAINPEPESAMLDMLSERI